MCAPKMPAPPDPRETASAQTGTNVGTSIANNMMGMVNQVTPDGSLSYEQTGTYKYTDPYTGQSYDIPRTTATTTLSPTGQQIQANSDASKINLSGIAKDQSGFLKDYLANPFNADTGAIEGRLEELGRSRLDPRFERQEESLRTRLANQGITPGSEAWNREMGTLGESRNDAYNQLMLTGRGQAFNELQALRNQPINEISALLSGSQVSNPNVAMMTPQGMPTTDVAGLINQNYNQRLGAWQQQAQSQGSLLGGLFGLGAKAIGGGLF